MASNLQRVRLICSNCGVIGVNIDRCEYCRLLPQCRKCRRRMPGRCFAKSTTPNICEVRHVLSVSTVLSFLPLCMNKQTRFSVLQTSVCVVQNCDAMKLRYQKLRARAALEGAHEEREFETLSGDIDFQTFLHRNAETIRKVVSDSLQQHGYIWFFSIIITMIVLSPISSRCTVKLYSRQKQVFDYMYLHNYQLQLQPITPMCR